MNKLLLYCLCFCTACATVRNETENRLWYTRPAAEWMEALPVGNKLYDMQRNRLWSIDISDFTQK